MRTFKTDPWIRAVTRLHDIRVQQPYDVVGISCIDEDDPGRPRIYRCSKCARPGDIETGSPIFLWRARLDEPECYQCGEALSDAEPLDLSLPDVSMLTTEDNAHTKMLKRIAERDKLRILVALNYGTHITGIAETAGRYIEFSINAAGYGMSWIDTTKVAAEGMQKLLAHLCAPQEGERHDESL